jgi:hypothetical protein
MTDGREQEALLVQNRGHTIGKVDGEILEIYRIIDVEQVNCTSPAHCRTVYNPALAVQICNEK